MLYDLVISGRIVDIDGTYNSSLGIKDGLIRKITKAEINGNKEINLTDSCLVFPGFIDCHVHLRQDASGKWNYKEDFATGSRAALHGGVTTVADMPNTPEPATDKNIVLNKIDLTKKGLIDILCYGGVCSGNLEKLKSMREFIPAFKIFTTESVGDLFFGDWENTEEAIKIISLLGKPIIFHCEDHDIIEQAKVGLEGRDYPNVHCDMRPPISEVHAVEKVLALCKKYRARCHIAHVSTKDVLRLIDEYSEIKVSCEAAPHHLFFSSKDMKDNFLKMNPPLRPEKDRLALLAAMKRGKIDMLASDHAPHTIEDKAAGAAGVPELDTYGNFVLWLLVKNNFKPELIARMTSYNPAKFLDLGDRGRISEGLLANLTILNTRGATKIINEDMQTKCKWSPFNGVTMPGKLMYTVCRGNVYSKTF